MALICGLIFGTRALSPQSMHIDISLGLGKSTLLSIGSGSHVVKTKGNSFSGYFLMTD
jgi:hypothetical protein